MKLVGSGTEKRFRVELENASLALAKHPRLAEILVLLGIPRERAKTLIPIDYFPDGGADFLRVIASNDEIITLDLPWIDSEPLEVVKAVSLEEYSSGLKRCDQIRLAVARDLAEQ